MADLRAEQIFSKVFGRPPESSQERSFLQSASQRKSGAALQGALEFGQQQGTIGGGSQQGQPQTSGGGDPFDAIQQSIMKANQGIKKANENLFKKEVQTKVREELIKNPGIQKLMQQEKESDKSVAEFDPSVEGSKLATASQQGTLKGTELSNLIGTQGDIGRSLGSRLGGIQGIIESIAQSKQEDLQAAQVEQDSATSALGSLIDIQGARQEAALAPLKRQEIESQIALNKSKALGEGAVNVIPGNKETLSSNAQAVLDNPAFFSQFTPTQRQKILPELVAYGAGADFLSNLTLPSVSGATREDLSRFDAIESLARDATGILDRGLKVGPLQSKTQQVQQSLGIASEDFTNYASLAAVTSAEQLRSLSGVAVTPQEFERLKPFLPRLGDQENVAKTKLNNFVKVIQEFRSNRIERALQTSSELKDSLNTTSGDGNAGQTSSGLKYTIEP